MRLATAATAIMIVLASCGDDSQPAPRIEARSSIALTSSAFAPGDTIPMMYTCDGEDVSPPLEWTSVADAEAYVIALTDSDSDGFVHWVVFNVPSSASELAEGTVPEAIGEGQNDFGDVGYGGPCPPEGDEPHHYLFTIYAVRGRPGALGRGASFEEMLAAIKCCVGATGNLTATYGR
jgi:Raf kinase inhibitor-like YbhB/YbcL family protein